MGARSLDGPGHQLEAPRRAAAASFYLDEASVTGTETALLAAAAAPGTLGDPPRRLRAARRRAVRVPARHGRRHRRARGTHAIRVEGGGRAAAARPRRSCGDYIEAGSWAVVAAITGGEIEIGGTRDVDMEVVTSTLAQAERALRARRPTAFSSSRARCIGAGRITTGLWPGFPSDLVSLVTVLATQADGATLVHDWLYELRLFALEQMSGMGADLFLCDPHRIIVTGPAPLRGKPLDSRDIRSGMALIAAALAAHGQSRVEPLETVERGYSRLVERLQALGAHVAKV